VESYRIAGSSLNLALYHRKYRGQAGYQKHRYPREICLCSAAGNRFSSEKIYIAGLPNLT